MIKALFSVFSMLELEKQNYLPHKGSYKRGPRAPCVAGIFL